ncbi:hypothetical protein JOB18_007153 [Solea senegalensis]|uniref:Uncharacterized protein n=1 Tax=Solea senegalensis TaxID=28829 RepID=A0AAV6RPB8_SOLSE|nr:hypothetical protein JOB18_007153 [Solea senegalensis]
MTLPVFVTERFSSTKFERTLSYRLVFFSYAQIHDSGDARALKRKRVDLKKREADESKSSLRTRRDDFKSAERSIKIPICGWTYR